MAKAAKNRELNLLLALDRSKIKSSSGSNVWILVLVIIIVILAFAAAAVYYFLETSNLQNEKDTSLVYLNDPITQAAYDESNRAQLEATQMQSESSELAGAIANLKTYPSLTSNQWKKLFRIAGGRVDLSGFSYDRTTGLLTFAAQTTSATRVPIFVAELRTSGIFADVAYEGYSGGTTIDTIIEDGPVDEEGLPTQISTTIANTSFSFNVTCLVKPPKAK
jgi:predicted negative regulator of RcsB-dependent stress response